MRVCVSKRERECVCVSGLLLDEPHFVAAVVGFDWRVVAAAEVVFALVGGALS